MAADDTAARDNHWLTLAEGILTVAVGRSFASALGAGQSRRETVVSPDVAVESSMPATAQLTTRSPRAGRQDKRDECVRGHHERWAIVALDIPVWKISSTFGRNPGGLCGEAAMLIATGKIGSCSCQVVRSR